MATYEFKRTKIGDGFQWVILRGTFVGMGKTKGRALLNLLNKIKHAYEKGHETERKASVNKKPVGFEETDE